MRSTVHVLATTPEGTRSALEAAVPLARGAGARLLVLVPHIVPYAVDVDRPLESADFMVRRCREQIAELGGDAAIRVCLCRNPLDITQLLPDRSTVVVGGAARRWIPTAAQRLMHRVSQLGHQVILVASVLLCLALAGARTASAQQLWQYGGFIDVGSLLDTNAPENHLFRNRATTPDVDEIDVNMLAAYLRKAATDSSRVGVEAAVQAGEDATAFGFSNVAPNISGADTLRHIGALNASYLAPVGAGLAIQGGIFSSLIGYDSLYAKDNLTYTRPWGADYTPYLMMGVNAAYPVSAKTTLTAFVINGYFHLVQSDAPSAGGQVAFKANERVAIKETAMYGARRFLSDSIVERKLPALTVAAEYQLGSEPNALWMAAQAPVQWRRRRWALTGRPEFAWDRDGRWIGAPQSVIALTTTVEYRVPIAAAQAILRGEYRVDNSRGEGGGFYAGADNHLTPIQNLFVLAAIVSFDSTVHR